MPNKTARYSTSRPAALLRKQATPSVGTKIRDLPNAVGEKHEAAPLGTPRGKCLQSQTRLNLEYFLLSTPLTTPVHKMDSYKNVYISFIHNNPKLQETHYSIKEKTGKLHKVLLWNTTL